MDRNAVHCQRTVSDRLCTVERIAAAVSDIEAKVKVEVKFDPAAEQTEQATQYRNNMQADVLEYRCPDLETEEVRNVAFPDWCADHRAEQMNLRRLCCTDYEMHMPNECHYFGPSGLGASRVCFNEFPSFRSEQTVRGMDQPECANYKLPCPATTDTLNDEQDSLKDYIEAKAKRYLSSPEFQALEMEISDQITDFISEVMIRFKERLEAASDFYIGYCILRLWFPTALLICRTPFWISLKRSVFGLSKRTFIVYVVLAWWVWDFAEYIIDMFEGPELALYIANIAGDPCYLDSTFLNERVAKVSQVCTELKNMSRTVEQVSWQGQIVTGELHAYRDAN